MKNAPNSTINNTLENTPNGTTRTGTDRTYTGTRTHTRKHPPHSPISFYLKLQALGVGFRIDELCAVNDRISIIDITGNRKQPEYMVYIDGKCKLPINDESAIINLVTTLCERKTKGNTYQFFIPTEEHALIAEGTKTFYYCKKDKPYRTGDMLIFRDKLHRGRYTETLITYIQEVNNFLILSIKKMEV